MDWSTPFLENLETFQQCALANDFIANNYSAVNTFLYAKKFDSKISIQDGWVFEKYCSDGKCCHSFPHNINGDNSNYKEALRTLEKECGPNLFFSNITKEEKDMLLTVWPMAECVLDEASGDYIYLSQNLAELPGKLYSKKRNHLNQFKKKYCDYRFELLAENNLSAAMEVENKWLEDSGGEADLLTEKDLIQKALDNFSALKKICGMSGGVVFVEEKPIAFCIASALSKDVTDVHFEKCVSPFDRDGGFAIINNEFSKTLSTKLANREEDLGIEGLRKAKLSYYPEQVLEKYDVTVG